MSLSSKMTDAERDQIDFDVHIFIKNCNELLRNYRQERKYNSVVTNRTDVSIIVTVAVKGNNKKCQQTRDHYTIVLLLIEAYLKSVCDMYTQQKAIRVKRACEKQRLLRLTPTYTMSAPISTRSDSVDHKTTPKPEGIMRSNRNRVFNQDLDEGQKSQETPLSPEEMQILDKENSQLFHELNALNDEVKIIGTKVVEIARLQEIFTEKVLEQEVDLNRLNETVIAATENIRDGNDQLREAMKKSAGFRVWVLFFIITLAFTVLFLDWYNP